MKKLKIAALSIIAGVAAMVFATQPAMALICPDGTQNEGNDVSSLAECSLSDNKDTLISTVGTIINFILGVLGIVAVVIIIYGGFTYMTSSGDSAKLTKARNTLVYGVIGLVVSLLAFAIVNFVINGVFRSGTM